MNPPTAATDRAWLRAIPKLDLHLHLDGALRVATVRDLAQAAGATLPTEDLAELAAYCQVSATAPSLMDFLRVFEFFYPFLKSPEAVERIAYELCEDCARERVVYFEARFAPHLQATDAFPIDEVVRAALRGLAQGARDCHLEARAILCACRHLPGETSLEVVALAEQFRDAGVVGIDLACDEREPASRHQAAFAHARRRNIHRTVHAGEAGPPQLIAEALDLLHAERIGHAVALRHDPALYRRCRDERIPLEINLTSNLQTSCVPSYAAHPFGDYFRDGLPVTLNTDDPGVSNITLTDEYARAVETFGLTRADVRTLVGNAVTAAFLEPADRTALRRRVAAAWPE